MLGVGLGLTTLRARAAGFSPADLVGLAGWWDASDTSTITESGGAVSQVDDKSGNGLNLLQAVAADQPTTGTVTVNGLNALAHDGSDFLQTAVSYSTTVLGGFTMVGVSQHISEDFMVFGTDSGTRWAYAAATGNSSTSIVSGIISVSLRLDGAPQSPSTRDDVYQLGASRLNLWTVRFAWLNAETRGLSPMNYPPSEGLQPQMRWCEAAVYDRQLSDEEAGQVEAYLAGKWGVTLA